MKATIAILENVRSHPNADRLQLADVLGNTIITSLDAKNGDAGIFFDVDSQLGEEYCKYNNEYSKSEDNLDPAKKGYFGKNRRVKAQRFRGEKSEGYFVPIETLYFIYGYDSPSQMTGDEDIYDLKVGDQFSEWGGYLICKKYVPPFTRGVPSSKIKAADRVEGFHKHFDTNHLGKDVHLFSRDRSIYVTEKMHGTSARVGRVRKVKRKGILEVLKRFFSKIFGISNLTHLTYAGSRNRDFKISDKPVVDSFDKINEQSNLINGKQNIWQYAGRHFASLLKDGEIVYFEIVGYDPSKVLSKFHKEGIDEGSPIQGSLSNSKLEKFIGKEEYKKFIRKYGEVTKFTYGCKPGEMGTYVYRITQEDESGEPKELTYFEMASRAAELGLRAVPLLHIINSNERYTAEEFYQDVLETGKRIANEESVLFPSHVREGVVLMQYDPLRAKPIFLKEKGFNYKVIEGIIKESAEAPDIEEIEQMS